MRISILIMILFFTCGILSAGEIPFQNLTSIKDSEAVNLNPSLLGWKSDMNFSYYHYLPHLREMT